MGGRSLSDTTPPAPPVDARSEADGAKAEHEATSARRARVTFIVFGDCGRRVGRSARATTSFWNCENPAVARAASRSDGHKN